MPIVIIAISGLFPFVEWLTGGDHDAIVRAFHSGLVAVSGGLVIPVLSLLFNWPWNLRDEE